MAVPRVFVSSTCYDLAEVRDSIAEVIEDFGFEAVLSERGDVVYSPDHHAHESCLSEVRNCQLFILVIGGRFGSKFFKEESSKSIVNVEYDTAKAEKIPVFTFVRRDVYSDFSVFLKNRRKTKVAKIDYPSIEQQNTSQHIFEFIENVLAAPVNNGVLPFDLARQISEMLRKQWAGLFYKYLQQRQFSSYLQETNTLLQNLTRANSVVEDLLKTVVRRVDTEKGQEIINSAESMSYAKQFYLAALGPVLQDFGLPPGDIEKLANTPRQGKWYIYLKKALNGKLRKNFGIAGPNVTMWLYLNDEKVGICVDAEEPNLPQAARSRSIQAVFGKIDGLSDSEIRDVLNEIANELPD